MSAPVPPDPAQPARDPGRPGSAHPGGADPASYLATLPFTADDAQRTAIASVAAGRSVLFAAPTGAGKTVVGTYAVWQALALGRKCFYTTPIKALSNQKYGDLVATYGARQVGLLTGDRSVNGDAPVVVMTTEVLRNMLYEQSSTLDGLAAVVLDEVHYLADRERGAVWEEVIIGLAREVALVCLSATVSNAEEFGAWLDWVRGEALADATGPAATGCDVVIEERRPVPLSHFYAVNDRIEPIFTAGRRGGAKPSAERTAAAAAARGGVPNPELVMLERRARTSNRRTRRGRPVAGAQLRAPRRATLARLLAERGWLPAIVFIFSRQGCEDAVTQLLRAGVHLTDPNRAEEIRARAEAGVAELSATDLAVLGYDRWLAGLQRGVAAHHAGLVPAFKEVVEELFADGLLGLCAATETLALGINMPARAVVIERLEKWDGQQHVQLTAGQLTQLTGRAGRRGIDERGEAVILHQRDLDFTTVASLVGRRVEPLRSRFAPSYNMAVNLLRRHDRATAAGLLARSFAQWQTDASVADDTVRIDRNRAALEGYAQRLTSTYGDAASYLTLRRERAELAQRATPQTRGSRREQVRDALELAETGDVLGIDGEAVVVVGRRRTRAGAVLLDVVTRARALTRVGPRELERPPQQLGRIPLPQAGGPRQASFRRRVAAALDAHVDAAGQAGVPGSEPVPADDPGALARLDEAIAGHPVHTDPAVEELARWGARHDDLAAQTRALERRVHRRTHSLTSRFDRIVGILAARGYLSDDGADPRPTEEGLRLAGIYAEGDLLLAECVREGLLDGLEGAELAAVLSVFTFETREKDPPDPVAPTSRTATRLEGVERVRNDLVEAEQAAGLTPTRPPDAGFAEAVWLWAVGNDLDDVLGVYPMTPGDFVRATKQVADVLGQLRDAAGDAELSDRCAHARRLLMHGVVTAGG